MDEFVRFDLRFGVCGVYLLLRKGEVVYAGQSTNLFARIGVHYQTMRRKQRGLHAYISANDPIRSNPLVFDEVRLKPCAKAELDREEMALIQSHMPKHNTLMKRPPVKIDLTLMPGFQLLLNAKRNETKIKRRKLPPSVPEVRRVKGVTLPRLKCLENAA